MPTNKKLTVEQVMHAIEDIVHDNDLSMILILQQEIDRTTHAHICNNIKGSTILDLTRYIDRYVAIHSEKPENLN